MPHVSSLSPKPGIFVSLPCKAPSRIVVVTCRGVWAPLTSSRRLGRREYRGADQGNGGFVRAVKTSEEEVAELARSLCFVVQMRLFFFFTAWLPGGENKHEPTINMSSADAIHVLQICDLHIRPMHVSL
jgi:hypothetical protein